MQAIHGLPITPRRLLAELRGASFCVSFADPRQAEDAIELVGRNGIVLLDNGAFSVWRSGRGRIDSRAFWTWANDIQARSPQAVAVVPDVIGGTVEENREEASAALLAFAKYPARTMFVYHMNEPLDVLRWALDRFRYIALGSCAEFDISTRPEAFRARLREVSAILGGARICGRFRGRYHFHLMRGLGLAHELAGVVDSADSTNVARNHCRHKGEPGHVARFAERIETRIRRFDALRIAFDMNLGAGSPRARRLLAETPFPDIYRRVVEIAETPDHWRREDARRLLADLAFVPVEDPRHVAA